MVAKVINGKELSMELKKEIKREVENLHQQNVIPHLTVILVGNNPASRSYVNGKKRASEEVGISSEIIELSESVSEKELLDIIHQLNNNERVHGILVQLPLPEQINVQHVIESIDPKKDVDGFHPVNIGRMMTGQDTFLPCTPYGIIKMLQSKNITIEGKHAVVLGRSNIVGKPVGQLLLNEHATVTYCHSKTKSVTEITKQADILVVAIGRPNAINKEHIKEGAVVIDVGINRLEDGRLTGDVDFESAAELASYITPVPRGVGPMTITMLLHNTLKAAKEMVI
ncbi:bifunctional methylenetetrahydrofolate dehydrogenase/methenyltetrahydrofolate cyclohydrolase FolD [Paucisalibacillus sp. EB02]|uniref:bifunctional methylenetetrahydrofolate dehydrogenase/methenyltetrahydrofolate cyclohydrolase FolD n=1 Tax=Paucisalibacillus sp. EB02 TaxID=1347087 RepID=UPI0004AF18A0|nr:bifunctional methylenetetrahydrofolate dehydrogenase/methenyltetrahydrofolate cyclohydrolase FolD [Paucisalibacillus sp. EB02]